MNNIIVSLSINFYLHKKKCILKVVKKNNIYLLKIIKIVINIKNVLKMHLLNKEIAITLKFMFGRNKKIAITNKEEMSVVRMFKALCL